MKKLFTTFLTLTSLLVYGQVPQGFSYQAVAFNSAGSPVVSSTVSVRISILDNSASGTALYTETHSKTTNASGLYSLTIGQGTPTLGTFNGINWALNPKFVKVEIDPTGGTTYTTVGTSQFLSVPFALVADKVVNKDTTPKFFVKQICKNLNCLDTIGKLTPSATNRFYFKHIDGTPSDVFVNISGLPSAIKIRKCGSNSLLNTIVDTIYYGMFSDCQGIKNGIILNTDEFKFDLILDTNISLANGNYSYIVEFKNSTNSFATFNKTIHKKTCSDSITGIKTTLYTNNCDSLVHSITITKTGTNIYSISNLFNGGTTLNNLQINVDCDGNTINGLLLNALINNRNIMSPGMTIDKSGKVKIVYERNMNPGGGWVGRQCVLEYK